MIVISNGFVGDKDKVKMISIWSPHGGIISEVPQKQWDTNFHLEQGTNFDLPNDHHYKKALHHSYEKEGNMKWR